MTRSKRYRKNQSQLNSAESPPSQHPSTNRNGPHIAVPSSNVSVESLIDYIVEMTEAKLGGSKKNTPGRKYNGTAEFLTSDNAEYLYLTNSYVARGLDTESEALIRNGWSVTPNNPADQEAIDLMLKSNNFAILIQDINRYIGLYGQPMMEMFDDKKLKTYRFELLPTTEMDYQRDTSQNIIFDENGEPVGFVQKRNGQEIAKWSGNDAKRIVVFKYRSLSGYYVGIPGIQTLLWSASEYGNIRSSIADSFVRSLPVSHVIATDASEEQVESISAAVGDKFTARTTYVTDERINMKNVGTSHDNIDVFKFVEPTLSEIAACFHMPIEMLAATEYLRGDDFLDRYGEWIEHIKMKQQILASIFERKVFNVLFPDGVTVKFNSPLSSDASDLIKTVGYAVQSNALTPEQALDILNRNQVFGNYTLESDTTKKVEQNGVQKQEQKEEVAEDTGDGQ